MTDHDSADDMTADEKRTDQYTRAPKSDSEDVLPRITVEELDDGTKRIDVADTAVVRPGNPKKQDG
jgi:hypothetical protein